MTEQTAVLTRVLRRETHAARTVPAVIVAGALILVILGGAAVAVWGARDPAAREFLAGAAAGDWATPSITVGVSLVSLLGGVLLVAVGLAPGHRSRRARLAGRFGLIIDDGVLADAAAARITAECGIPRAQVAVTMRRRRALVWVTPTSGVPLVQERVREAVSNALGETGFEMPVRVTVARRGVVS